MKIEKSVTITLIISAVILIVALLGYSVVNSILSQNQKNIDVNGVSSVKVTPDIVGIYFNAEAIKDSSEEASSEIALVVSNLQTSLEDLGFNSDSLKTENYNIRPNYIWTNGRNIQKGYIATQTLKVELNSSQFSLVDEVIDSGVNAGANINYINYELSTEAQSLAKAEAIKLASVDAKLKADSLAEGLGKEVGDVISTSIDNYDYYPWRMYEFSTADSVGAIKAETQNINPSAEEVSASVRVTFKLK